MSKTIAVIGAGAGLGQAVARRFGREGFGVALVARTAARLDALADELRGEGIDAAAFPCDVADRALLTNTVHAITARFGQIDVVEFAPTGLDLMPRMTPALDLTAESLEYVFDLLLRAPMTIFGAVLPGMLARGDGALLIGTGGSTGKAYPRFANIGIAVRRRAQLPALPQRRPRPIPASTWDCFRSVAASRAVTRSASTPRTAIRAS